MYADIIVDISHEKVDRSFQYRIPSGMEARLQEGMKVRVPFGSGNREITGYVIEITSLLKFDVHKIKDIIAIEEGVETIESRMIALGAWLSRQYGVTMNQALKTVLPVKVRVMEKQQKKIVLAVAHREAKEFRKELQKRQKARIRLVEALLENSVLDYTQAMKELQLTTAVLKALEEQGIIRIESDRVYRGGRAGRGETCKDQSPTPEQQEIIEGIGREFAEKGRPCLLHGVTGSGKTQVYIGLIQEMLNKGKQAILLIPEIALTYPMVSRFYEYFGEKVAVLHSRLSQGERYDQMEQAKTGRVQVMIGPRSALFTPFSNLGLIVIDEEHESSYKSEQMPRYHARDVAIYRGEAEGAMVVLGSATPSVDAYYKARAGVYALFTLDSRYENRSLPLVRIVDLREEIQNGNRSIISGELQDAMEERLEKQEQIMLFLNRRGYAGFVSCRVCGYVAKCPHCDVSMSLHNNGKLICHYCGHEQREMEACPACGSSYIGGFKAGTQQIERVVQKLFPQSRILRMDFDTTRRKDSYGQILEAFARREADILIGTQMIVKGHDFPHVTLVGVLAADLSLNSSDFRSGERTFQLLTQAVGRAGRGRVLGEAVIQTYQPEHYSILGAVSQDYESFYEEEISYRSMMRYPPAAHMLAVYGASKEEQLLEKGLTCIRDLLLRMDPGKQMGIIGPAPESVGKVKDYYRRVLYIKHKDRKVLTAVMEKLEEYIEINRGFRNIAVQFDFHN